MYQQLCPVTRNRRTKLVLGFNEPTVKHREFDETYGVDAILRTLPDGAVAAQNIWVLPGGSIALRPYGADQSRLLIPDVAPSVLGEGNVNKSPSLKTVNTTPWDPLESTCRHASLSIL